MKCIVHLVNGTTEQQMCRATSKTCTTYIECEYGTQINITVVKYRDTVTQCLTQWLNCGWCCYEELSINTTLVETIGGLCNGQQTCNLNLWKPATTWKMLITYNCNVPPKIAPSTPPTTTIFRSTHSSPKTSRITDSWSPQIETTDSRSPKKTTASTRPQVDTTYSTSPQIGTTYSTSPQINTTYTTSPQMVTTDSTSPQIETTDSTSPHKETTNPWSQKTETADSASSIAIKRSSHSPAQSTDQSRIVRTKEEESGIVHLVNDTTEQQMCRTTSKTCTTYIECEYGTRINITVVKYRDTVTQCLIQWLNCGWCCYEELSINTTLVETIGGLCNGQQTCNLNLWKPATTWKMLITYNCNVPPKIAPSTPSTTTISTSTHSSPKTTEITDSRSPQIETTDLRSPKKTTSSTRPQVDTTNSTRPQIETTNSSSPQIETNYSTSPQIETTYSTSPQIETTYSTSPQIETTYSTSPQMVTTDSTSPQINTTDSTSIHKETTNQWSQKTETADTASSIAIKRSSHSPAKSTDPSRIVRTKEEESANFSIEAAIAIPVGIVVLILVIVGIVCVVRRRSKGKQIEGNTLPMQDMTDNYSDNPQLFDNSVDLQEAHEQQYVHTTSNRGTLNITCDSVEQKFIDTNQGGINTTDDDEYNTLNTHQSPIQIDPNYDYLPSGSHTIVDETYSHVTDSQTAVPDATY